MTEKILPLSDLKLSSKRTAKKQIKTHPFKGSLKDLINTVAHLRTIMKKKDSSAVIQHFEDLFKKQKYIAYKKHLGGVCHHKSLGPSRRPLKTYRYIIEVMKNLKTDIERLKNRFISRIIVNISTKNRLGGVISKSHNMMYRKDSRRGYLTFFIEYDKE